MAWQTVSDKEWRRWAKERDLIDYWRKRTGDGDAQEWLLRARQVVERKASRLCPICSLPVKACQKYGEGKNWWPE